MCNMILGLLQLVLAAPTCRQSDDLVTKTCTPYDLIQVCVANRGMPNHPNGRPYDKWLSVIYNQGAKLFNRPSVTGALMINGNRIEFPLNTVGLQKVYSVGHNNCDSPKDPRVLLKEMNMIKAPGSLEVSLLFKSGDDIDSLNGEPYRFII